MRQNHIGGETRRRQRRETVKHLFRSAALEVEAARERMGVCDIRTRQYVFDEFNGRHSPGRARPHGDQFMAPLLGKRCGEVPKLRRKIVMDKKNLHFASLTSSSSLAPAST
jgi:hypothetical protein